MNTQEDYISFEIAKLLKENGFNEETEYVFSNNGELLRLSHFGIKNLTNADCNDYHTWKLSIEGVASIISAPTLQMAMKWLRKVHKIHITIGYAYKADANLTDDYVSYCFEAENAKTLISYAQNEWYDTYEQACEAAVKYCLENMI